MTRSIVQASTIVISEEAREMINSGKRWGAFNERSRALQGLALVAATALLVAGCSSDSNNSGGSSSASSSSGAATSSAATTSSSAPAGNEIVFGSVGSYDLEPALKLVPKVLQAWVD